jgi:type IV pilus biogenesis protein CpaD/CtpE
MRATIVLIFVLTAALSGCASTGAQESETTMATATKQQKMSCRREKTTSSPRLGEKVCKPIAN